MENQLKNDFEKIVKTSGFSKKNIDIKKIYLNEFIKKGLNFRPFFIFTYLANNYILNLYCKVKVRPKVVVAVWS